MYLQVNPDGSLETIDELPENVVEIADSGKAQFVQVNDDGLFERLRFGEPEEGTSFAFRAIWEEV